MHVAAQQHRVGQAMPLQRVGQAPPCSLVAVPAVVPQRHTRAGPEVAPAEQGLLADDIPGGAARRLLEGAVQPLLLHGAQQGALRVVPAGAALGVHHAGAKTSIAVADLRVSVMPVIQQIQRGQPAEGNLAVDAHLGAAGQPRQRLRQHARAQRHVLVEGLVGRGTAGGKVRHGRPAVAGSQPGVVVLHLMVVPGHQPGAGCVRGLQFVLAAVQGIAGAVVVQRQHPAAGGLAHRVGGAGVLVYVVAQEQHHIGLVVAQVAPGAEIAMLPALA
ncbi:MAG: hypothetical protein BWX79_02478 [Alphaproteobacteria bacterium ADurb.Bin100]|nr:MAG: hypothetical protein BWX79_02478 [Alphaproteobacteria bacterium ADurb.Bin100]